MEIRNQSFEVFDRNNYVYRKIDEGSDIVKEDYVSSWNMWKEIVQQSVEDSRSDLVVENTEHWQNSGNLRKRFWSRIKNSHSLNIPSCIAVMISKKDLRVYLEWHGYKNEKLVQEREQHNSWLFFIPEWIKERGINTTEYKIWTIDDKDEDFLNYLTLDDYQKRGKFQEELSEYLKNDNKKWVRIGKVFNKSLVLEDDNFTLEIGKVIADLEWLYTKVTQPTLENDMQYTDVEKESIPFYKEEILSEVFMSEKKIQDILETLDYKNNIILQGPPGVGKTFLAKRLAYLHMGQKDDKKIEMIQFHQSYSYEEFIRGYKPNSEGNFSLKDGIFYSFCKKACESPQDNFYMIIDEINRGNLSKIFGEVMMLIEADKRGKKYSVKLAYSEGEETFYIPKNIYMIGTMNTADRSLALVDYALRRRFSFISVEPGFHTDTYKEFLLNKGLSQGFIDKMVSSIIEVNQEIIDDTVHLGKGYEIGHSYFCPILAKVEDEQTWYERIIRLEIAPLLKEYWFDQEDKVNELLNRLQ